MTENGEVILEYISDKLILTADLEEVQSRISDKKSQTGKWAEYIQKWESEDRI